MMNRLAPAVEIDCRQDGLCFNFSVKFGHAYYRGTIPENLLGSEVIDGLVET